MPMTVDEAAVLLRTSLAGDPYPVFSATRVGLVTDTSGTGAQAPTATGSGNAIPLDPRVPVGEWTGATTASGVTSIQNVAAVSFENMPNVPSPGVTHINIYDSAATPRRKYYGPLSPPRIVASGDTLTFAIGSLKIGMGVNKDIASA